jgi:hypothetical protein
MLFNGRNKMITPEMLAKSGSEQGHAAALFAWSYSAEARKQYPELKWLFSIPNGGYRQIGEASRLKATGVKAGVPDMMLPVVRFELTRTYCGLWLELKIPRTTGKSRGYVTPEQKEWLEYLNEAGYCSLVAWGWLDARRQIEEYLRLGK